MNSEMPLEDTRANDEEAEVDNEEDGILLHKLDYKLGKWIACNVTLSFFVIHRARSSKV
jgi:hypothetical protein